MEKTFVLKKNCEYPTCQIEVKKSRFIAEIFPIDNSSDVRQILKEQKQKYKDARHVVHAFILSDVNVEGCSDDGEPSGTAGKPVLEVLKGSKIQNVLICVTRYFGGILLGTGGLVKAYSSATKMLIEQLQLQNLIEEKIEMKDFEFSVLYEFYDQIKKIFALYSVVVQNEDFQTEIFIKASAPQKDYEKVFQEIKNATCGSVNFC